VGGSIDVPRAGMAVQHLAEASIAHPVAAEGAEAAIGHFPVI